MLDKNQILSDAKEWFKDSFAKSHIANTEKLIDPNEFNINHFTAVYLANFLTGNSDPESIAKALLYPRVLGTSVTTIFGTGIQKFTNDVLGTFGSTTNGIDIEFVDQIDGHRKYCQLKSDPNTINKDDVETIAGHFTDVIHLSRTNNLRIAHEDLIVGVIYGTPDDLSNFYRKITRVHHYPVFIGQEFWHRLTGDHDFYDDLLSAIGSVATEADFSKEFEDVIRTLAQTEEIQSLSNHE
ncbi:PmeII family type II restriction endonuclease [Marinomonas sp. GJ51-6]|uniref:PmeII family type II restriction endonuclease n=1 Tax=Marinomonas sp. GJ51-6 TaxID=2992802 RepID=UPI0029350FAB|nr:PmeII family type II restriction endonuclease [Marinomonas sp. GJ51-6]WOD06038.1 PmeII family type II restriction endonuclease [Marinomonas sp. GJ51-6]